MQRDIHKMRCIWNAMAELRKQYQSEYVFSLGGLCQDHGELFDSHEKASMKKKLHSHRIIVKKYRKNNTVPKLFR